MSGIEVFALVAAIISAFSGTASFLIACKARKEDRVRRAAEGREKLGSLVTLAPRQIQAEYDQDFARIGQRFAVGDAIAREQLAKILIGMQMDMIQRLQNMLLFSEPDHAFDYSTLLNISDWSRSNSIASLAQQYQRFCVAAPISRMIHMPQEQTRSPTPEASKQERQPRRALGYSAAFKRNTLFDKRRKKVTFALESPHPSIDGSTPRTGQSSSFAPSMGLASPSPTLGQSLNSLSINGSTISQPLGPISSPLMKESTFNRPCSNDPKLDTQLCIGFGSYRQPSHPSSSVADLHRPRSNTENSFSESRFSITPNDPPSKVPPSISSIPVVTGLTSKMLSDTKRLIPVWKCEIGSCDDEYNFSGFGRYWFLEHDQEQLPKTILPIDLWFNPFSKSTCPVCCDALSVEFKLVGIAIFEAYQRHRIDLRELRECRGGPKRMCGHQCHDRHVYGPHFRCVDISRREFGSSSLDWTTKVAFQTRSTCTDGGWTPAVPIR